MKGCANLAHKSLQCPKALTPFLTPLLTTCDSIYSGFHKLRPWLPPCQSNPCGPRRLQGCVASRCTAHLSSRHVSWLSHCLLSSSHCATLSSSCRTSWLPYCLLPSSHCATLSSSHCTSLLSHHLSLSSCCAPRHPLILSLHRLVVALPLDAQSSCRLVVPPLDVLLRQLVVAPSSLIVLSLHRPLVLSLCWPVVALPLLAPPSCPLVMVQRRRHQTPSKDKAGNARQAIGYCD